MAEFRLTPGQHSAVYDRGRSILVSAAAGSGKTRVLTERLMAYITDPDDPKDIDSFLIITYTRAAAAELRGRILAELNKKIAADPENRRLRRQSSLCCRAQIGTIHSFCTSVIRENSHLLGLTPDFAVAEEDRCDRMKRSALDRLLSAAYENIENDADFRALVDTVGAGRDDSRLGECILSLHQAMQSHAYPEKWARIQQRTMEVAGTDDFSTTPWGEYLLEWAERTAACWQGQISALLSGLYSDPEGNAAVIKAYGDSLAETAAAIDRLVLAGGSGWDSRRGQFPIPFPRLKPLRGDTDAELRDRIKALRENCRDAMEELEELFSQSSAELMREITLCRGPMCALLELTLRFDEFYSEAKRRAGVVDFSDLEHMACRLLADEDTGEPTALARELSARYTEIMVDEYQDVNAVQDLIFTAVSKNGRNLFTVGDVKQSIYRFRLADPGIFIGKYLRFGADAQDGERILLQENFRSRASVLDAANHVFSNIMSRTLGEIDYDADAALKKGADFPEEGEFPAEMLIFPLPDEDEDDDSPDKTAFEAGCVARRIKKLISDGAFVYSGGEKRRAGYGDVVILLRSPGSDGAAFRRALLDEGVPVASGSGGGFFASSEISMALAILRTADNPRQDIPLISALSSPAFGFTADELAVIRAGKRSGDFYSAVLHRAETDAKCRGFLDFLAEIRAAAPELPTDELICMIYDRLGLENICAAMDDGQRRVRNLAVLAEYARKFESDGYRGLFRFTAWMERLAERGEEPFVPSAESSDAVRIMSIHRSKGLEFPFVFLCSTAHRFNRLDTTGPVLCHPELGLGPKIIDVQRGIEYPSPARRAVSRRIWTETLSEEMRILYVAMTRAKERLFITCVDRDPEKTLDKLRGSLTSPIQPTVLEKASSMSKWLIQCAMLPDSPLHLLVETDAEPEPGNIRAEAAEPDGESHAEPDSAVLETLPRTLMWRYAFTGAQELPSKLTATELKAGRGDDPEALHLTVSREKTDFRLPELSGIDRPLSATEKGTAAHLVMQFIDFAAVSDERSVAGEIERLRRDGFVTPQQAEAVSPETILAFFRSDIGRRIAAAEEVRRELPFSLLCPASDFIPGGGDEKVLLQGVIDCCILEDGEMTIIDYKTDGVTADEAPERAASYSGQLRAYAGALQRITGRRVRQAVLYFLRPGVCCDMDF